MALQNIPVLPSGYPLFSLADWPSSLAALVSGGLTSEFEKECWNAIIAHLEQTLTDAGLEWDNTYTTAEGAKITDEYGDLYAAAFNSVRHNIDLPAPLGWAWSNDASFHGYVGREDFRGVDAYGERDADDVYAEYIPELIRKLNLLIEIMRCNGHLRLIQTAEAASSESYNKAVRVAQGVQFGCYGTTLADHYNRAVRRGIAGRVLLDFHMVPTQYTRGFYRGFGKRLLLNNFEVATTAVNLMRRGIPAYLSTDKSLLATDASSRVLGGSGAAIIYQQSLLSSIDANVLGGRSALVIHQDSVINDILTTVQPGIGAAAMYRDQTATDILAFFRAGRSLQVATDQPLVSTDHLAALLSGAGRRVQHQESARITHTLWPIRRGWGGRLKLDPFNTTTSAVNLMRGGIPVYLATNKSLLSTEAFTLIRGAASFLLAGRVGINTNPFADPDSGAGMRIHTDKPSAASITSTTLREALPRFVLGREISDSMHSRANATEAPPIRVLGRETSDTSTVHAEVSHAPTAPVLGRGTSDTKRSRAGVREGDPLRLAADSESDTGHSHAVVQSARPAPAKGFVNSETAALGYMVVGACMEIGAKNVPTVNKISGSAGSGSSAVAVQTSRTLSTKISCASGSTETLEFVPEIASTLGAKLNVMASEGRALATGSHKGTTTHKHLILGRGSAAAVTVPPNKTGTYFARPEAVAGRITPMLPVSQNLSTDYRRPSAMTGFPVYAGFVPESLSTDMRFVPDQAEGVGIGAKVHSRMLAQVSLDQAEPVSTPAKGCTETMTDVKADAGPAAGGLHIVSMKSGCAIAFDTAWLSPVWESGGLWIRQVQQNATWLEDGLFVLEFCGNAAWFQDGLFMLGGYILSASDNILEVM